MPACLLLCHSLQSGLFSLVLVFSVTTRAIEMMVLSVLNRILKPETFISQQETENIGPINCAPIIIGYYLT